MTHAVGRPRAAPRLAWSLLLLGVAGACGEPAADARLAVLERGLGWEAAAPAPADATAISGRWDLATSDAWRTTRGDAERGPGGLALSGLHTVEVEGPDDFVPDASLHNTLAFRASTRGVYRIDVFWRALDGRWFSLPPLVPDGDVVDHEFRIELDSVLRQIGKPGIQEGFDRLRLSFSAPDDARGDALRVDVALASIELRSRFDVPAGEAFAARELGWGGVHLDGVCARVPARMRAPLRVGEREVLRLQLAAPGEGRSTRVRIADADARLAPIEVDVVGGAPWFPVEIDLSPLAGRDATLRLEADGDAPLLLLGGPLRLGPAPRPRPDVVLYVEDTLRADRLGTYGYEHPTDPVLQRIAAAGVTFTRCFAASNWTLPSVTSLLTSLDPADHGSLRATDRVTDDATTLAEVFAAAGYLTLKLNTNMNVGPASGLGRGFDVRHEPSAFPRSSVDTTLTSHLIHERLRTLLERHPDTQVFVWLQSLDPHVPYVPPREQQMALLASDAPRAALDHDDAEIRNRFARSSLDYDAEILHNDEWLGALDALLAERGRRDDTLLAFASDHGEAFFEHGQWEHLETLHQEEVHVPWVVRWPARVPGGRTLDVPVTQLDVAPTLASLAGLASPTSWRGRDLSPLLLDVDAPPPPSTPFLIDAVRASGERDVAAVLHPWKLIVEFDADGTRTGEHLYDLSRDPREHDDRGDDPTLERERAALLEAVDAFLARDAARAAREPADEGTTMDPEHEAWLRMMGYIK